MRNYSFLVLSLFWLGACNQYSTSQMPVNPAILLGPSPSGTSAGTGVSAITRNSAGGVVITVAAHNSEPTFQGYSIYQAATEAAVMDLPDSAGTKCGPLIVFPTSSIQYTMEASTHPLGTSTNLLCIFPIDLTTGNYVSIRARYIAGIGQPEVTSMASNALLVP